MVDSLKPVQITAVADRQCRVPFGKIPTVCHYPGCEGKMDLYCHNCGENICECDWDDSDHVHNWYDNDGTLCPYEPNYEARVERWFHQRRRPIQPGGFVYDGPKKGDVDNRANQLNPNNPAYWSSRGKQ